MDGCPTAQLAARTAAGTCFSSRCRIAGRDFCHELMVDAKLPVKTEDMWKTLFWHWFDKPLSFSKQAAYSDRARDVLRACQRTVHHHWRAMDLSTDNGMDPEQKQFFFMAHEMSTQYTHAPQRFASIAEPWQNICRDLTANMFFLSLESDNKDLKKDVRDAAKETFECMDGSHALFLGLSTDMMTEIWKLCMHVQKTRLDPAIVPRLTRCHLVVLDIAIAQCGLLTSHARGSYTHMVLQQMRQRPLFYCNGQCNLFGNELDRPSQDLAWVKSAVSAAQRALKAYSEMVNETIGQSYAEQHLECFDLFTWYTLDRSDPDTVSKNYPGLLTADQLEQHYQTFCLTMGFTAQVQSFRRVKTAALTFFSDGMAKGLKDTNSEHGGGSFNQECWRQGYFMALGAWQVQSEKPKLSAYFSVTRDTMSNERTLMKMVQAMNCRSGRHMNHFQRDCLVLLKCSGPKSAAELITGTPPLPTDFLNRANQEWVNNFGRRYVSRKQRRDTGKSHAQKHTAIGGKSIPLYSGPFMRNAQHAALAKMTGHMQALESAAKKEEPTVFSTPVKTFKRKLSRIELNADQLKAVSGLKKRRDRLHSEQTARVNVNVNPYVTEHQSRCKAAGSDAAKLQAALHAAKLAADQEKHVFRMNSDHAPLVRGVSDRMPLHYKLVSSTWDAEIILVSDLAVVDTLVNNTLMLRTVLHGRALGCRFAVEQYLRSSKDHWQHPVPLSIKFKPAISKPAGLVMTPAFQAKHKSTTSFLEQLVLRRNSKWQLLDADQRARWEKDKRSKLVTVLDSHIDVHNLVRKLSEIDVHGSSATPFTHKMLDWKVQKCSQGAFCCLSEISENLIVFKPYVPKS